MILSINIGISWADNTDKLIGFNDFRARFFMKNKLIVFFSFVKLVLAARWNRPNKNVHQIFR